MYIAIGQPREQDALIELDIYSLLSEQYILQSYHANKLIIFMSDTTKDRW